MLGSVNQWKKYNGTKIEIVRAHKYKEQAVGIKEHMKCRNRPRGKRRTRYWVWKIKGYGETKESDG